jgi:hypothetical protein
VARDVDRRVGRVELECVGGQGTKVATHIGLRCISAGVYSLPHSRVVIDSADRGDYDRQILRMLLRLHVLGVFDEHRA